MVERYRRSKRKRQLMGNHQKCWIWGRHTVLETLRAGKWPILELIVSRELAETERREVFGLAAEAGLRVRLEESDAIRRLCGSGEHQGLIARMPPYPYDSVDSLLETCPPAPLFVILDSFQDPYNFGALLRSADIFGVDGVFVSDRGQVDVTSLAARASAGAVNHVRIAQVASLPELARRLRERGVSLVAASEKAQTPVSQFDFRQAAAVIIGNEGAGIRPELLELCDAHVTIPQQGHVGSLNAAVSAGVLLYEASRQRSGSPQTFPGIGAD